MTYQLMDALPNLDVPVAPSVSHRSAYVKAASDENFVWDQNDSKATAEIELLMEFIKENA